MPATQKHRFLAVNTALGDDVLLVKKFSLRDEMGRLFRIELDLRSTERALQFNDIVGTNATLRLDLPDKKSRYFNGFVSRFVQMEHENSYARYQATLVPWLWFLTRTSDCRIFQKKKVPDILEEVFKVHGFNEYELKLTADYRQWEYCVQYRETDFNFVSRLMEQEGIYYYFKHENGLHKLVLTDAPSMHEPFPGYDTLVYRPATTKQEEHAETVTDWVIEEEVQPGLYSLADFNFSTPKAPIQVNANISRQHQGADYEVYDYPGEFDNRSEGEQYAKVRIQELQVQHEILRAQATVRGISTGCKFTLKGHPRSDQDRAYIITGSSLHVRTGEYESSRSQDSGEFFSCSFTAMPATEHFRSARITPKPVIQGPQTAIVVGPKGAEIHTNNEGQVKLQFHWDRYGKLDENSSCWVRVSQAWAGKGWGSMSIPRIGQEVIVEFLEGDPDRPIITGNVYNADQPPPYGTTSGLISGFKSKTHKGSGANELSMDHTTGKENFFMNAQYDMNSNVNNNQSHIVGVNQTENVGADRKVEIGGNDKLTVGGNRDTSIGAKHDVTVGSNSSLTVGGKRSESIAAAHKITNKKMSITSSSKYTVMAGSKITETSPSVNLLAGSKFKAVSGGKMNIKAGSKLSQQSGSAMNIKSGATLHTQSEGAMNLKSDAALKAEAGGSMNLKSSGSLVQKGSVIKLNSPTKIKGTTLTVS